MFLKTFNLVPFESYIYIMQEAKKSMSSLNLVCLPTLQVTICALFYGPVLYKIVC